MAAAPTKQNITRSHSDLVPADDSSRRTLFRGLETAEELRARGMDPEKHLHMDAALRYILTGEGEPPEGYQERVRTDITKSKRGEPLPYIDPDYVSPISYVGLGGDPRSLPRPVRGDHSMA